MFVICSLLGKTSRGGNKVSFSHRKTRRIFKTNIHWTIASSKILKRNIRLRLSSEAIRLLFKKSQIIDDLLLNQKLQKKLCLNKKIKKLQQAIVRKKRLEKKKQVK